MWEEWVVPGGGAVDPALTLQDSAQCFVWRRSGNAFGAVIGGRAIWLEKREGVLYARGGDAPALTDYLDLARDYAALRQEAAADRFLYDAMGRWPGLRVLNQPPWDALVQFILSANNNVSRIRSLVVRLAERFGEAYDTPCGTLYALPTPNRLKSAGEAQLRALGVGYRAPYLIRSAAMVDEGFPLDRLRGMSYDEAHRLLLALPGVGDKVADCVLLFGCRQSSAFPVDVWIQRALVEQYGFEPASRKKLQAAARERFGAQAGIYQQFLFHGARTRQEER